MIGVLQLALNFAGATYHGNNIPQRILVTRRRHQIEIFPALLAICAGNSPVPGEFPTHRPVTRSFDVFFDLRLNKRLSNNREAGDLRRYRAYYDGIVMNIFNIFTDEWHIFLNYSLSTADTSCVSVPSNQLCREHCTAKPSCHAYDYTESTERCCLKQFTWGGNGFYDALLSTPGTDHYSQHCPKGMAIAIFTISRYNLEIQSRTVITRSSIVRYYINNYRNWGRISIRCWIHKRHPIPRPNGQAMGCLLGIFVRKLTTYVIRTPHCVFHCAFCRTKYTSYMHIHAFSPRTAHGHAKTL